MLVFQKMTDADNYMYLKQTTIALALEAQEHGVQIQESTEVVDITGDLPMSGRPTL